MVQTGRRGRVKQVDRTGPAALVDAGMESERSRSAVVHRRDTDDSCERELGLNVRTGPLDKPDRRPEVAGDPLGRYLLAQEPAGEVRLFRVGSAGTRAT